MRVLFWGGLVLLGLGLAAPARAGTDFYTKYHVDYRFDEAGNSIVSHKVSLTNNLSRIYASQYQMTLSGEDPAGIRGRDGQGELKITTSHPQPDQTLVKVDFNEQVVGKGNTLNFTLTYSGVSAIHNGRVWEVFLPKIGNPDQIDEYDLTLTVPASFGKPAFISPQPVTSTPNGYVFSKDQVAKVGVVAAFGNFQTFSFDLGYRLDNPGRTAARAQISLPPDTGYQKITYDAITPPPVEIIVDEDGNWLGNYVLLPQQNLTVTATGQVNLLAEPTSTLDKVNSATLNNYLKPTSFWPADDPAIRQLAQRLRTPRAIYNYVVSTLTYDYNRAQAGVTRRGASEALVIPNSSLCTEFTDLFVALARAAGIPAREVNGHAHTTDPKLRPLSLVTNILHAWPQYFDKDKNVWISVDPTWENTTGGVDYFTKLDFNHFAFVTHGLSDSQPPVSAKNIQVNLASYRESVSAPPRVEIGWPRQIWPFAASTIRFTIINPSGRAVYRLPVEALSTPGQLTPPTSTIVAVIPPFSRQEITLPAQSSWRPDFDPKQIKIRVAGQETIYNVPRQLFIVWQIGVIVGLSLSFTAVGFVAAKAGGIYLQRRA